MSHFRNLACRATTLAMLPLLLLASQAMAAELRDEIDAHVRSVWKKQGITPVATAEDGPFLRRVYLDLVGTVPGYAEALAFLDDKDPQKRSKLIDKLLADPRFAEQQSTKWDMVLFGRNPPGSYADSRKGFQDWLTRQFADNVPYDQWAKAILKAEGNTAEQGAPMYLVQYRNEPEDAADAVTRNFLGTQLGCARCHDHPFEDYSQTEFYGMAAFFVRLNVVEAGKVDGQSKFYIGEKRTGEVLFTGPAKDQVPGQKGDPVSAKFLKGDVVVEPEVPEGYEDPRTFPSGKEPPKPDFSRKDLLAEWIASSDNNRFNRTVANRVWSQYMGRGIVHPVEHFSEANEVTNPELLDTLTKQLVAHKYDLKWYIREICNSQAYQLSPYGGEVTDAMPKYYERARVRPLSAEELAAAWRSASGYEEIHKKDEKKPGDVFSPFTSGYMLSYFGRPSNGVGDFQGGLQEHLYLNNGQVYSVIVSGEGGVYDAVMKAETPIEERVERLYVSILNRRPTPEEATKFAEFLTAEGANASEQAKFAIWTLLTCSEFRFNH